MAQVYCSMAEIYAKLEKPLEEQKYYLKAARTYYQLLKNRFEIKYSSKSEEPHPCTDLILYNLSSNEFRGFYGRKLFEGH